MNLSEVTDLSSIGTLFAFVLVCAGVLKLHYRPSESYNPSFKVPYINARWIVPPLYLVVVIVVSIYFPEVWKGLLPAADEKIYAVIPIWIFFLGSTAVTMLTFWKKLSLIPVLGLLSCLYLMSKVHHESWWRFAIWLCVGLVVYFLYGRNKSKLAK